MPPFNLASSGVIRTRDVPSVSYAIPPPPATRSWDASPIDINVSPSTIPATAPIGLDAFLAGDNDVCQVAAKVPVGWSYNGWYYTEQAVKDIAYWIGLNGITASLGHVDDKNAPHEFKDVAVVWVGAQYNEEEKATYARGYVNPERPDVKRLIRSGVVNRVSPDAIMHVHKDDAGHFIIDSLELMNLDLVPRLRNGTESGIAARDMFNDESDCAGEVNSTLSEENKQPEATAEVPPVDNGTEIVAEATDSATPPSTNAEEGQAEGMSIELKDMLGQLGDNPVERLKSLLGLEAESNARKAEAVFTATLKDMVEGADAQELITLMVKPQAGDTAETVKVRITDCLNDPKVKKILASKFNSPIVKGSTPKDTGKPNIGYRNY